MSPAVTLLLTFLAAALAVAGAYSILTDLFLRDRSRVGKRVDDELRKRQREKARQSALFKNLGAGVAELAANDAETPSIRERFVTLVDQSGLTLTPRRLLVYMAVGGAVPGALVALLNLGILATVATTVVGAAVPFLYVAVKRAARLNKLMAQLPDTFDLMARVIRAGQTMSQALQAVADEFDAPVSVEFAYCYEQQNLGLSPEVALRDLARRTGLLEMKIFVLAMLIQQQAGGNLAELLDKLSNVIRERFRIRSKIKAMTAEGRMQAAVLLALPPGMFFIILLMNRSYGEVLLQYPSILAGILVSELLGALWIRHIVNFDF